MANTRPEYFYYPFSPNWDGDGRWRLELQRDPVTVRRALSGWGRILTSHTIYAQSWAQHPLALEYQSPAGRWRMLEIGAVLARLRQLGRYSKDLLEPKKYLPASAELRAMLLLTRMGLSLQREPSNVGAPAHEKPPGPDLLGFDAKGSCGIEVKCPVESESARARLRLVTHIAFRTQELLGSKGVNIALNRDTITESVIGRQWANTPRADNLLLDALVESEETGTSDTSLGQVAPAPEGFSSMIGPVPDDEEYEAGRLRSLLQEAAAQLREWSPGIVVIDTSADPDLMLRCCSIAALMSESWASELAAVMLVASTHPGFVVTIVPGPLFTSGPLLRARACLKGHIHVDTFGPRRGCAVNEQFDEFPAYCIRGKGHYPVGCRRR